MVQWKRIFKQSGPANAAEDVDTLLDGLCAFPGDASPPGVTIPEHNVIDIRQLLYRLDCKAGRKDRYMWCLRPRIYAILRVLESISLMDEFIRLDLNDIYLPWKAWTFPTIFSPDTTFRDNFLRIQHYYLAQYDVKSIELGKKHQNLRVNGDTYFRQTRVLGQGGFGGVDEVRSNQSLKYFARKRVSRGRDSEYNRRRQVALVHELENLRSLSKKNHHRHLVRIVGSYTDPQYIAYLMEPVAHANLEQFLGLRMNENTLTILRQFYGCLAGAIHHLHRHKIRHRDLTARNILIYRNEVYVSDFGAAYSWAHLSGGNTRHLNPPVSRDYMAPEISRMEERGEPSDMWSLGVIFLEMTTRLLGRQVGDLKQHIHRHAVDNKAPPFYFANVPAVTDWLRKLSAGKDSLHDNEPISWVRDLMHPRPEDRPSAWELMKDILESPSFNSFCCFKCHGDYHNEAFAYDSAIPRGDGVGDATTTITDVAQMFSSDKYKSYPGTLTADKLQSISNWIPTENSMIPEDQHETHLEDRNDYNDGYTESYDDNHFYLEDVSPWTIGYDETMDLEPQYPAVMDEQKFSIDWNDQEAEELRESMPFPIQDVEYQNLQDSNLGFMEYDDVSSRPYDEMSDRTDNSFETMSNANNPELPALWNLKEEEEAPLEIPETDGERILFDEESDNSDSDVSHDEEENDKDKIPTQSSCLDTMPQDVPSNSQANETDYLIQAAVKPSQPGRPDLGTATDSQDGAAYHPPAAMETQTSTARQLGIIASEKTEAAELKLSRVTEASEKTPISTDFPSQENPATKPITVRSSGSKIKTITHPPVKAKATEKKATKAESTTENGKPPKERNSKEVKFEFPPSRGCENLDKQPSTTPAITVEYVGDKPSDRSRLSKANLAELNKTQTPQDSEKKGDHLGVDAAKLMADFCDLASSAPSSQLTETTKKSLDSLLFRAAPTREIERTFVRACQDGKNSIIKYMLQDKWLAKKSRSRWRVGLAKAVQGASRRNNKCVRTLIEAGVDVNERSKRTGMAPLHLAIENQAFKGYSNLIWLLVNPSCGSADANLPDFSGDYPITKIFSGSNLAPLEQHRLAALAILLQAGVDVNVAVTGSKNTPLHLAVRRQDHRAVAMLLYKKANVNTRNAAGATPLHTTANQFRGEMTANHAEVLDLLLRYGADVNEPSGALKKTALDLAKSSGTTRAIEMLTQYKSSSCSIDKV